MTPGLAKGPPFPSRAIKGSTVAVASLENPTVPMVVGSCEIDIYNLSHVQGAKGHAVKNLHWQGDEIWAWSHGGISGGSVPGVIEGWGNAEDQSSAVLEDGIAEIDILGPGADQSKKDTNGNDEGCESNADHNNYVNGEAVIPWEHISVQRKELSLKGNALL